ncbi:MAG: type I DNA topoisomerase [Pseudomonadota bacterium]|nr:type I DNA topoisomerase [Pseudomonadota bacterium]
MGKSLVIVESPAKAKTINKYLGKDFLVKSSVGHIRDLPVSGGEKAATKAASKAPKLSPEERKRQTLIRRMGIDPEQGWAPTYQVLPGKEKVVNELKRLAEGADDVYLATDLDREGEAIAWHLKEIIGGDDARFKRVVFSEITKPTIQKAFEKPSHLNMDRVEAQQTRRFLDRVVGFMLSPLLWKKVARGLSAGRVQSVAVRMLVEREREIRAFVPEEYWQLHADLNFAKDAIRFEVVSRGGQKFRPTSQAQTQESVDALETAQYQVTQREQKKTSSRPSAPFITSTMQQAASTRLGYGVKRTMTTAQKLYEAGYITYMRTDSTNISAQAVDDVRQLISSEYGNDYLPESPNSYASKAGAQEAHEAIRPTNVALRGQDLPGVDRSGQLLYDLIRQRFIACQMNPARYLTTTLTIDTAGHELKAKGRVVVFDGFTRVYSSGKSDDPVLPDVKEGDTLKLDQLDPTQHFTKPPARYTEASLVRELEKRGIGRPSTYASIISTIQDRGYVHVSNKRFFAEKIGDIVTDRLVENFEDLMSYGFTANMEEKLDEIAEGERDWKDILNEFYREFKAELEEADSDDGMRSNDPVQTDIACPTCDRSMMIRTGSTGVFLGCSGYSLKPKDRCTQTMNLIPGDEIADDMDDDAEAALLRHRKRCPKCSSTMDSYLVDETRKLYVCSNQPDCDGTEIEKGEFKIKGYEGPVLECDKCGSDMQLKSGRFGKYFGCTNESCKNTRKLLKNGEPAPPKADPIPMPHLACEKVDDHYLLRDGASGIFLAASQFPKNRETRAPSVKELLTVKDQLDPKFKHLISAPTEDPDGHDTFVRFSRKTKEHYVRSEIEGKPTKWQATFEKGKWVANK